MRHFQHWDFEKGIKKKEEEKKKKEKEEEERSLFAKFLGSLYSYRNILSWLSIITKIKK